MEKDKQTSWLLRLIGGESKNDKKAKAWHWIILFIVIGMGIMIIASFFDITEQAVPYEPQAPSQETSAIMDKSSNPKTMQDYEKIFENQITELLTSMIGIEEVTVKVNLESTEELIIEKNRNMTEQITKEKDKQGGTRDISDYKKDEQVVLYQNNDNEQPLIIKTLKPKVRGVVIVAKGAEKIQIKALISEAVQRFLDIPPYKIAILPGKS